MNSRHRPPAHLSVFSRGESSLFHQAVGVARVDVDVDKAARREFIPESELLPPAIMYRGPDGSKKWFVCCFVSWHVHDAARTLNVYFVARVIILECCRYQGRPRSIDILEFVSTCMSKEVATIDDLNYKSFLADNEGLVSNLSHTPGFCNSPLLQVRVMLFARDNNVKLYRVFNSLAIQYPQMKFAVVAQTGAKALETKYCNRPRIRRIIQNLTPVFRYRTTIANKAMIIVKDRSSKPLKMSSRLIYDKMLRVFFPPFCHTIRSSFECLRFCCPHVHRAHPFTRTPQVLEPNKFPVVVAATQSNIAHMCDPPGGQPCVLLVVPKVSEELFTSPAYVCTCFQSVLFLPFLL